MRYIIGLLLGIGLIVLTFILIFRAFSGGSDTPKNLPAPLSDYSTTQTLMRYTIDGPEISEQKHARIRISVSKDQVLYEQIQGYEGKLVNSKAYPNNTQAYATFLRALDLAGYATGNAKISTDERGHCPTGQRLLYEILDGSQTTQRWWSTSCGASQGSFLGKADVIRTLFQRQIPDYGTLTNKVNVTSAY